MQKNRSTPGELNPHTPQVGCDLEKGGSCTSWHLGGRPGSVSLGERGSHPPGDVTPKWYLGPIGPNRSAPSSPPPSACLDENLSSGTYPSSGGPMMHRYASRLQKGASRGDVVGGHPFGVSTHLTNPAEPETYRKEEEQRCFYNQRRIFYSFLLLGPPDPGCFSAPLSRDSSGLQFAAQFVHLFLQFQGQRVILAQFVLVVLRRGRKQEYQF